MLNRITRRQALVASAASTSMFLGRTNSTHSQVQNGKGPGREPFWGPGPDKNIVRDLTPGPTPIRLSKRMDYVEDISIGDIVRKHREEGLAAAYCRPDAWHSISDSELRELKEALKQHDVNIFEVGGYRNLVHPDESVRQEYIKRIVFTIEVAEKLGCPMVGTIAGTRNTIGSEFVDNYNPHPDNWMMETWNLLIDSINTILKDTAGMKAVIGIEAQITTIQDTPLSHKRLMEDVGSERLKVNLDPTNMSHFYNYFHSTELINECFDLCGENIMGCHAKDRYILPHSQTVHVEEVCPGRGTLDYETYLIRMSWMKWPRALSVEHFPEDQNPEAFTYIRKVAGKVGVKVL